MDKNILSLSAGIKKRKLRITFSRKEKLEKLIKKLKDLKEKKSVSEDRYNALTEEYDRFLSQAESKIKELKENLNREIEEKKNGLKTLNQNLENLETRFKVGELTEKDYHKSRRSIEKRIKRLKKEIPALQTLIDSKSSSNLGGYLDVKIEGKEGILSKLGEIVGLNSSTFDRVKEFFLGFISSPKKIGIVVIVISLVIGGIILLKGSGLAGKYVNINNESETMELYKEGTFSGREYGINLSGNYKVKGNKIIFTATVLGASVSGECRRVKNGFDCEDGSQYRKVKRKPSAIEGMRDSPSTEDRYSMERGEEEENEAGHEIEARDSRIISAIGQARTVMTYINATDGNYDNFNCNQEDMRMLCREIRNNGGTPNIAKNKANNSDAACIYSPLNAKANYWYCADSSGVAGFATIDPSRTGYCINGTSAICPALSD